MPLPKGRNPLSSAWFAQQTQDFSCVNRVEVIDNEGRSYTKYGVVETYYLLQDGGTTLKLFVKYKDT
jgi:hypothetical protein